MWSSDVAMNRNINNGSPASLAYMLPGDYTLTIDGVGDFTGEFAFRTVAI